MLREPKHLWIFLQSHALNSQRFFSSPRSVQNDRLNPGVLRQPLRRAPMFRPLLILCFLVSALPDRLSALDSSVRQLVVSIAPDWDSYRGRMQRFERDRNGVWRAVSDVVPVLYGKSGLAWGRGVLSAGGPGPQKTERDKRAPAGVFKIG